MKGNATVVQEYQKIPEKWRTISKKNWQLAIWVCEFSEIEIIDMFMDIEASPIGEFDEIFFRFDVAFDEDKTVYEQKLWEEYCSWFEPTGNDETDLLKALHNEGLLHEIHQPDTSLPPTFASVLTDLRRLRKNIQVDELPDFVLFFPIGIDKKGLGPWMQKLLKQNALPLNIKIAVTDLKDEREFAELKGDSGKARVVELYPNLNMFDAIKNDIKKGAEQGNPNDPADQYKKQLLKVMELGAVDAQGNLDLEVGKLLEIAEKLKDKGLICSSHLVAATLYYGHNEKEKTLNHAQKTITLADKYQQEGWATAYPTWRSAKMILGGLYLGMNERENALKQYLDLAQRALPENDAFYLMESYRMAATIPYQDNDLDSAWNWVIRSLEAGTKMPEDVRRQSTYLYSAQLAYQIASERNDLLAKEKLTNLFQEWIGDDWDTLLQGTEYLNREYLNSKEPVEN